ncbi:hypothetical protein F4818DRAFT_442972 [Hypoxylon cercidicola]|nr:hypothetical protein F4818DRAFT_442972 [Hypoxylon cercidicola]
MDLFWDSYPGELGWQAVSASMKSAFAVIFAALATLAAAAPLNINLGAYSPALVVGDGAIGFNGAEGEAATEGAAALQGAGIASA